ncbi:MAG: nickel-dependent lactate racemase [Treponema sp.]|jgi:nickel-dependent lactate racemase|nr:nickel-dependent lactate racemase [Treponema sp.]
MPDFLFPYGKGFLPYTVPASRFRGEMVSRLHRYRPAKRPEELVDESLSHPVGTSPLHKLAEGKRRAVLVTSDHTRPVPSRIIIPRMLAELRRGNPSMDITILVATGCHRETSPSELEAKFGPEIFRNERVAVHNCDSPDMANLGKLPSGGDLVVNRLAAEADLLVAEGCIEPHFFAGYSGGRKSVLPGIAGRGTVLYNHNARFMAHPAARAGILDGNPVHDDMIFAARAARLAFICNVVINAEKEVIYSVSGDCDAAHREGAAFLSARCGARRVEADIVISTNGGYPLDQNIYQAVKGMTAAEAAVRENGVIIMIAESADGHGGEEFYKTFRDEKDLDRMLACFMKTPPENTRVDQWQSQIFARVLRRAGIVYVSKAPGGMVRDFHMAPARSVGEAVEKADAMTGRKDASIAVIPDGVSVIVT